MQSIVELQKRDHAYMNELFDRYNNGADREGTFRELVSLVATHAFAEEEVLFPVARRVLAEGNPLTGDIEDKHQRINDLLREMETMTPTDSGFEARVEELFPILRSDAREEEDVLLPALSSTMSDAQLKELGAAWLAAKKTAPNRAHPHVSRRPPGNALSGLVLTPLDRIRGVIAKVRNRAQ